MIVRICGLLIFVFSFSILFIVSNTTYSAETSDTLTPKPIFDSIEYNFTLNSNVIELTDEDSKKIMRKKIKNAKDLNNLFEFDINEKKKLDLKQYKVLFADTGDRKLKENNYILRIRPRLKYKGPENKSKITIKNRSKKIENIRVLNIEDEEYGKPKKEIDINGGNRSYSVSNDIKFNYKEFLKEERNKIENIEHVTEYMKKQNPELHVFINTLIEDSELIIPGVVDRYKIRGKLKEEDIGLYSDDNPDFDLEIWVFKKNKNKEYLVSLSFKGAVEDMEKHLKLYKEIYKYLKDKQLLSNVQGSKTKKYFEFFADSK